MKKNNLSLFSKIINFIDLKFININIDKKMIIKVKLNKKHPIT